MGKTSVFQVGFGDALTKDSRSAFSVVGVLNRNVRARNEDPENPHTWVVYPTDEESSDGRRRGDIVLYQVVPSRYRPSNFNYVDENGLLIPEDAVDRFPRINMNTWKTSTVRFSFFVLEWYELFR